MHAHRTGLQKSVRDNSQIFGLWVKIPVAAPCWCWSCPSLPHKWLFYKWLQLDGTGEVKQGPCQRRPSRFEVNFSPWLRVFLCLWGEGETEWVYCCLIEAIIITWRAEAEAWVCQCHPFVFPSSLPVFYSSTHPPPFPPFSSPHPYLCSSSTPWPWPSACSFAHPHVRKSLLPVSAGKLFCPPIPCFHYLV